MGHLYKYGIADQITLIKMGWLLMTEWPLEDRKAQSDSFITYKGIYGIYTTNI